jgi:hypothetical protein
MVKLHVTCDVTLIVTCKVSLHLQNAIELVVPKNSIAFCKCEVTSHVTCNVTAHLQNAIQVFFVVAVLTLVLVWGSIVEVCLNLVDVVQQNSAPSVLKLLALRKGLYWLQTPIARSARGSQYN